MVDNISKIQQLLVDSKFVEAQKASEVELLHIRGSESKELLELYFQSLKAQEKNLPVDLLIIYIEKIIEINVDLAEEWMFFLKNDSKKYEQELLILKIRIAEKKGRPEELYKLISKYHISRIENRTPSTLNYIDDLVKKYFKDDFNLSVQKLALDLSKQDLVASELRLKNLLLSCFEKKTQKGIQERLNLVTQVLESADRLYHIEVYRGFAHILSFGLKEKKEIKKMVELVIFLEDFSLQALLLDLLVQEGLDEVATNYAKELKGNKDYSFLYIQKNFPRLKPFFLKNSLPKQIAEEIKEAPVDLDIKNKVSQISDEISERPELTEEEIFLSHAIKYQSWSFQELLDLSVSLFQTEFYYASLKAADLAYDLDPNNVNKLKAMYLKVTCYLKCGDSRAALDASLQAISMSVSQNDFLSFLYSQAEAYMRLKEVNEAKKTLRKILSIDPDYRMAKQIMERLNAV
jgi:hypothetical protein